LPASKKVLSLFTLLEKSSFKQGNLKMLKLLKIVFIFFALIAISLSISYYSNKSKVNQWLANPQAPGQLVDLGKHKLYATLKGEGEPTVVIITGGNSFSWSWWTIQDDLAKSAKVLTYDRSGYGWSEKL